MPPLRTKRPYAKAFLCATIIFLIGLPALYAGLGDNAINMTGQLAGVVILPALLTGFMARRAVRPWSMGKIASMFIFTALIIGAIGATAISVAGTGP